MSGRATDREGQEVLRRFFELSEADRLRAFEEIRDYLPVEFYKVIAFVHDETGKPCATGYTMSQDSFLDRAEFVFGEHESRQARIALIERRTGLSFGPLARLDPLRGEEAPPVVLRDLAQIRLLDADH